MHTNTIEGFLAIFKRGMRGDYQHCGKQHLHRCLAEFDFRYSNRAALDIDDATRADLALKGIAGRRLLYRRPCSAQAAAARQEARKTLLERRLARLGLFAWRTAPPCGSVDSRRGIVRLGPRAQHAPEHVIFSGWVGQ